MSITPTTPVIDLAIKKIAYLSTAMAKRLAIAVASNSAKSDLTEATVEDLLNYFPMRYEDRSNFITIDKLYDGIEASVEIHANVSGGYQVGKNRDPRRPKLYIFEITGTDSSRRNKPVSVKWFISGKAASQIVSYYESRFQRGTRFVAHGRWEFDERRQIFSLKITKPEELEILPEMSNSEFQIPDSRSKRNKTTQLETLNSELETEEASPNSPSSTTPARFPSIANSVRFKQNACGR